MSTDNVSRAHSRSIMNNLLRVSKWKHSLSHKTQVHIPSTLRPRICIFELLGRVNLCRCCLNCVTQGYSPNFQTGPKFISLLPLDHTHNVFSSCFVKLLSRVILELLYSAVWSVWPKGIPRKISANPEFISLQPLDYTHLLPRWLKKVRSPRVLPYGSAYRSSKESVVLELCCWNNS